MGQIQRIKTQILDAEPPDISWTGRNYNLHSEEEFLQAGSDLIALGRTCLLSLGNLLQWKLSVEGITDRAGRDKILGRYASAWGVGHSTLYKALINVAKHPEIERPQDVSSTLTYEVLAGSETAADAEAGFEAATSNGWNVKQVREVKFIRALSDDKADKTWMLPALFLDDGCIWARNGKKLVKIATLEDVRGDDLTRAGINLIRYRCGI